MSSVAQGKQDIRNLQVFNKLVGRSVVLHGQLLVRIKFVVFNPCLQGFDSLEKSLNLGGVLEKSLDFPKL